MFRVPCVKPKELIASKNGNGIHTSTEQLLYIAPKELDEGIRSLLKETSDTLRFPIVPSTAAPAMMQWCFQISRLAAWYSYQAKTDLVIVRKNGQMLNISLTVQRSCSKLQND